jgi:cytochrome c-type biogenesis protein CcmH
MLYVLLGLLALAVAALLAWPLLRRRGRPPARRAYDLTLYKAQLEELDAERARGLIGDEEAAAARLEIERRLLRAAEETAPEDTGEAMDTGGRRTVAAASAVFLLGLAGLLYLQLGRPDLPDRPAVKEADLPAEEASPDELAVRLHAAMQERPDELRGWLMLGSLATTIGRFDLAADAYRNAAKLEPGQVSHWLSLGEALVGEAAGLVTAPAREAFSKALQLQPDSPMARYYVGLADFQRHEDKAAYERWSALAADTPPDASWAPMLGRGLDRAARRLGREEPRLFAEAAQPPAPAMPGPSQAQVEAAGEMSAQDRAAMIQGMVQGLADRLERNPDDLEGWLRLGRAYMVLERTEDAIGAYREVLRLDPGNAQAKQALAALKAQ